MLVSSPTAISVTLPGRALISRRMNSTAPDSCRLGEEKPLAHSTCFMYCVAVDIPAYTGTRAHLPPATLSSLAASRARAPASLDTVVTPSSSSSGRWISAANA